MALAALLIGACAGVDDFVVIPGLGATRIDVPRPTTSAVTACTVSLRSDESVAVRAAALRQIGLFAGQAAVSDTALGAEIEAAMAEAWGEIPPPTIH